MHVAYSVLISGSVGQLRATNKHIYRGFAYICCVLPAIVRDFACERGSQGMLCELLRGLAFL